MCRCTNGDAWNAIRECKWDALSLIAFDCPLEITEPYEQRMKFLRQSIIRRVFGVLQRRHSTRQPRSESGLCCSSDIAGTSRGWNDERDTKRRGRTSIPQIWFLLFHIQLVLPT